MIQLADYPMTILEHHLDTFGHVNNATYLEIYEEARWEIITKNGYGMAEIQKARKGPVILEVKIQFLKELRLREKVTIRSWVDSSKTKSGVIIQDILKADGSVASKAEFLFGLFDMDRRRLIAPTEEWMKALQLI